MKEHLMHTCDILWPNNSWAVKMFRKFSLFDSSPPPAKISIAPPKSKAQRKSPIKCAIISSLQLQNSPEFTPTAHISKQAAKRSKSLDESNNKKQVFNYHNAYYKVNASRSSTLPPVIRELPQSPMTTTVSWYAKLGNSFRRGTRKGGGFQYKVNTMFQGVKTLYWSVLHLVVVLICVSKFQFSSNEKKID